VDTLRFLPTQLRMSSQAQGQAAKGQQQQGTAAGDEHMQDDDMELGEDMEEDAAATAAAAAAAAAKRAAAAARDRVARRVSPFRREMQDKLIKRIHKKHAKPWLKAVLQKLRQLLPSQADLDRAAEGEATDNRLLALLSRGNFARLSPGVVTLGEIAKVSVWLTCTYAVLLQLSTACNSIREYSAECSGFRRSGSSTYDQL
jgi:hypothetical protein